ncbi:MAG: sensor histidine kinase [Phormidesmis sp.]
MLNKDGKKAEILIVDDVPANLKVLSELLSAAHYQVAAVTSGKRALRRLQNYLPDLILLDIQMPEIDGFETCRQIKSNPDTAHLPIVFITALSDVESIAKGFSLGAVDYICKPFQERELLARVNTHIKLQSFSQELEHKVSERTAELQQALAKLEQSRLTLIQQEKMSDLGNLVAGVAHEINNPIGFLNGSIENAQEYLSDILEHLKLIQNYSDAFPSEVSKHAESIDLAFLCEDFPTLLNSMKTASDRIKNISTSLRTFSRTDDRNKVEFSIHEGLESTLTILKYRLNADDHRPAIKIVKQYGDLPSIKCFPNQLNQVFMNILANAIDAFDEAALSTTYQALEAHPQILTIDTGYMKDEQVIQIKIKDNGKGMTPDVKAKIFDHLFTTKAPGKGTGLGLAIAQKIIIETHEGRLNVQSDVDQGTAFCIQLPF